MYGGLFRKNHSNKQNETLPTKKHTADPAPRTSLQSRGRQPEHWTLGRVRGIAERQLALGNTSRGGWLLTGCRGGLHTQCSFPWVNGLGLKPRYQRCSKSPDQPLLGQFLSWLQRDSSLGATHSPPDRGLLPEAQERAKNRWPAVWTPGSHPLDNLAPSTHIPGVSFLIDCPPTLNLTPISGALHGEGQVP